MNMDKKKKIIIVILIVCMVVAIVGACSYKLLHTGSKLEQTTQISEEPSTKVVIAPPTITGVQTLSTEKNIVIDVMQGITAKSADGVVLTNDIKVYPTPDYSAVGSQMLNYTVTDLNGVSTILSTTLQITEPETEAPTEAPTQAYVQPAPVNVVPTEAPTVAPTEAPTTAPTQAPSVAPTQAPASSSIPIGGGRDKNNQPPTSGYGI